MIHLGMSGKLRIQSIENNFFKKHDHAELIFSDEKIIYNDVRRFGSIHLTENFQNHRLIKDLGIEPLSKEFNKNYLFNICKNKNINIKKLIWIKRLWWALVTFTHQRVFFLLELIQKNSQRIFLWMIAKISQIQ